MHKSNFLREAGAADDSNAFLADYGWFWCWWWKCFWIKTVDADDEGDFYANDENSFESKLADADDEGVVESQRESILLLSAAISRQNPAAKSPVAEFTTHLQNFHKLSFHISQVEQFEQNRTEQNEDV